MPCTMAPAISASTPEPSDVATSPIELDTRPAVNPVCEVDEGLPRLERAPKYWVQKPADPSA